MDVCLGSGENRAQQCFQHKILIKFMGNKTLFSAQYESSEKCSKDSLQGYRRQLECSGKLECLLVQTSLNFPDTRYLQEFIVASRSKVNYYFSIIKLSRFIGTSRLRATRYKFIINV